MIFLDKEFSKLPLPARILTQTHDSILSSHHKSLRKTVRELYITAFNQPLTIFGKTFLIPIEITHGPNWRDLK